VVDEVDVEWDSETDTLARAPKIGCWSRRLSGEESASDIIVAIAIGIVAGKRGEVAHIGFAETGVEEDAVGSVKRQRNVVLSTAAGNPGHNDQGELQRGAWRGERGCRRYLGQRRWVQGG
jgi:hypothetical protein